MGIVIPLLHQSHYTSHVQKLLSFITILQINLFLLKPSNWEFNQFHLSRKFFSCEVKIVKTKHLDYMINIIVIEMFV